MIYQIEDKKPSFSGNNFIAPNAVVIGDAIIEKNASIWFNVVIRADNDKIVIGENSNIQDGSILHVDPGHPMLIGDNVTVGHKVMLHGCTIGDNSLIGMNAVVLNGAKIGKNCIIGANALVPEGMEIADGSMVLGSPGKVVKQLQDKHIEMLKFAADHYVANGERYNLHGKVIG
ncbi:gamma carbonic anhydrase family protein [Thalassotalea sp. HSM 43]|uniref:gamma carbonic anhydrase family protein n=1 Tax=Thalassotalea sp. HSM 43 TaxID=2552945 RepID=UPI0010816760|nr:gamma carbonic anhydrase family protein [Thalassotalea sp. HSM 43]QBY03176.1 gamma carbonic anhydrase family protein [Thalassotalea sp. HSM 43]